LNFLPLTFCKILTDIHLHKKLLGNVTEAKGYVGAYFTYFSEPSQYLIL